MCKRWRLTRKLNIKLPGSIQFVSDSPVFIHCHENEIRYYNEITQESLHPASVLYKSIAERYWPVRVADGPISACYRFM